MKYKITVLLLVMVMLLAGCSRETHPAEETVQETYTVYTEPETVATEVTVQTVETQEETVPETAVPETEAAVPETVPVDESFRAAYDVVLEQYREAFLMDSQEFIQLYWNWQNLEEYIWLLEDNRAGDAHPQLLEEISLPNTKTRFPDINAMILFYMHQYKQTAEAEEFAEAYNFQYAYCDLDGNGKEELVVCERSEWGYSLVAVYALGYENKPIALVDDVGDRVHLNLYRDGILCINGSSSAFEFTCEFYRLDREWGYLQSLCSFTVNSEDPDVDRISQLLEQFESGLTPIEEFAWEPLFADS